MHKVTHNNLRVIRFTPDLIKGNTDYAATVQHAVTVILICCHVRDHSQAPARTAIQLKPFQSVNFLHLTMI